MNLLNFTFALILLAIALVLLWYFVGILYRQIFRGGSLNRGNYRLKRALKRIQKADDLMAANEFTQAIAELRRAILLDMRGTPKVIGQIKEHHQNILSRCLIIAEELGSRAPNIAEIEKLFLERAELLNLELKTGIAYAKFRSRRQTAGKEIPDWSKGDFERRAKEVREELARNLRDLQDGLNELFTSIQTPASKDNITIH